VARALVLRPALVLVDEPTSHQDEGHARAIMDALAAAAAGRSAVLVASHDAIVIDTAEAVIDLDV
jgi:ABC-type lipoprotein export system ATPase subunit